MTPEQIHELTDRILDALARSRRGEVSEEVAVQDAIRSYSWDQEARKGYAEHKKLMALRRQWGFKGA